MNTQLAERVLDVRSSGFRADDEDPRELIVVGPFCQEGQDLSLAPRERAHLRNRVVLLLAAPDKSRDEARQ
jgi:hypothetical protein